MYINHVQCIKLQPRAILDSKITFSNYVRSSAKHRKIPGEYLPKIVSSHALMQTHLGNKVLAIYLKILQEAKFP